MTYKVHLNVENRSKRFLIVIIEPSAETYAIPLGKTMTIIGTEERHGDAFQTDSMHIEYLEEYIKIWEWENCKVDIYIDGKIAEPGIPDKS